MFYTVLIIWLLLDQLTKYYVMNHFLLGESLPVIPNVFHLTYIINGGAAFGMLASQRWFFLLVAFVDRYMIHGVVDFFDFRVWPIFNVADIGICIGVAFVVFYLFSLKEDHE